MIKLYNTAVRRIQPFKPILKNTVKMYSCGPTVYAPAHLGNLRSYVFADILKRTLLLFGYRVKHVMNITDVGHLSGDGDAGEDKVERSAREQRRTAWDIAAEYTALFQEDLGRLNILPPTKWVKATDHIKQQIALVARLEKKGFTYQTSDGVYFDTSKFPRYAAFAQLDTKGLEAGKRIDLGEKKNKTDFALWKFSYPSSALVRDKSPRESAPKRDMEWQSPWGVGFPGWHTECSAMARKYLGQPFDIHTGGIDHIPVHHTNEIAQSEAAYGKPLAHYWLHNEFLVFSSAQGARRMGKSEHNTITVADVVARGVDSLAYRYLCLTVHYRKRIEFSWQALEAAARGLQHLRDLIARNVADRVLNQQEKKRQKRFERAIAQDLDTPAALAIVWDACKKNVSKKLIQDFDLILGLDLLKKPEEIKISQKLLKLVQEREQYRKQKEWSKADAARKKITDLGYAVEDTPEGSRVMPLLR